MPELPDLEYIVDRLQPVLCGRRIDAIQIKNPIVIRSFLETGPEDVFPGQKIADISRHGPFLTFRTTSRHVIVIHPMLAGRLSLHETPFKPPRKFVLRIGFEGAPHLAYSDSRQMGKIYFGNSENLAGIPRYESQGVDILSPEFTLPEFLKLIKGNRRQVRVFLMQQELLSAIGNAYADEILFAARLHPKTLCSQLGDAERERLYHAIRETVAWGIKMVRAAAKPIEVKVREHVKVRNRYAEPCPECGTKIRRAGVLGYDAYFCPSCQPSRRSQFIDWGNT